MTDQIIAAIGSETAPILLKLNEYKGRHLLDIRRYYYDRGSRELKPTHKGINLNQEAFAIVKNIIQQQSGVIEEWLSAEQDRVEDVVRRNFDEQVTALEQLRTRQRSHVADQDKWKSSSFFDVSAEGGRDRITYNLAHQFKPFLDTLIRILGESSDSEQRDRDLAKLETLFQLILIAYSRSKMLFEGAHQMSASDIFETLEMNWGAILGEYIEAMSAHD